MKIMFKTRPNHVVMVYFTLELSAADCFMQSIDFSLFCHHPLLFIIIIRSDPIIVAFYLIRVFSSHCRFQLRPPQRLGDTEEPAAAQQSQRESSQRQRHRHAWKRFITALECELADRQFFRQAFIPRARKPPKTHQKRHEAGPAQVHQRRRQRRTGLGCGCGECAEKVLPRPHSAATAFADNTVPRVDRRGLSGLVAGPGGGREEHDGVGWECAHRHAVCRCG